MKSIDEVFGTDEMTVKAIWAFADLRDAKMIGMTDELRTVCAYTRLDGSEDTYEVTQIMDCTEFVDFVKGFKGIPTDTVTASYVQGQESGRYADRQAPTPAMWLRAAFLTRP